MRPPWARAGGKEERGGKERRRGSPSSCRTPVSLFLPMGCPSRFRTPSFIYVGRGCPSTHKFHAANTPCPSPCAAQALAAAPPLVPRAALARAPPRGRRVVLLVISSALSTSSWRCHGPRQLRGDLLLRDAEGAAGITRRRDLILSVSRKRCRIFINTFPSSSVYSSTLRSGVASTVRVDIGGGVARAMLVRGIIHLLAIRRV